MIKSQIHGNLISLAKEGRYSAIVHGCNCFCTMGGGIALTISKEFPQALQADLQTEKGDEKKLGTYTESQGVGHNNQFMIINAYTQYDFGEVDYNAIENVFSKLNNIAILRLGRMGIPKIGAGLAGGDWGAIEQIINKVTPNLNIELVLYDET